MADEKTHDFDIQAGGHSFEGEIEFNIDNKVSFSMNSVVDFELEDAQELNKLFERVQIFFKKFDGFDKIEITKKA